MSGKFFEVNKGSNQHQKFIEDHDDEGYGGESDDDENDGDDENGDHDGDDENGDHDGDDENGDEDVDDSDNEDRKFVCPTRRAIPQTGHKPD